MTTTTSLSMAASPILTLVTIHVRLAHHSIVLTRWHLHLVDDWHDPQLARAYEKQSVYSLEPCSLFPPLVLAFA